MFTSIVSKLDTPAILELPKHLIKDGFSNIASGVEVPTEYDGLIPENCEIAGLEACKMLYFESEPFTSEEEFFPACETVFKAVEKFDPTKYGFKYADDLAPRFNFGGETSVRYAIPIQIITSK